MKKILLLIFALTLIPLISAVQIVDFYWVDSYSNTLEITYGEEANFEAYVSDASASFSVTGFLEDSNDNIIQLFSNNYAPGTASIEGSITQYQYFQLEESDEFNFFINVENQYGDGETQELTLVINDWPNGGDDNHAPTIDLTYPSNNAEDLPTELTFEWNGDDIDGDNLDYKLYLRKSYATGWNTYETQNEYYSISNLDEDSPYYWKVSVSDGEETVMSEQFSFTTEQGNQNENIPPEVTDIFGYNEGGVNSGIIHFQATAEDSDGEVLYVKFYLYKNQNTLVEDYIDLDNTDGFTYDFDSSSIEYNAQMYIKAKAQDDELLLGELYGEGPFTIDNREDENNAPTINLVYPLNNENNIEDTVTFEWNGNDIDGDNLYYTLYLKKSNSLIYKKYCRNTELETCTISGLKLNTNYNWKVSVSDNEDTVFSETRDFRTRSDIEPFNEEPIAEILSPYENEVISDIYRMSWNAYDFEDDSEELYIKLEYSPKFLGLLNYNWNTIYEGSNTVNYAWFDTFPLNNGEYSLRLTVIDTGSKSDRDTVDFFVENGYDSGNDHPPRIISDPIEEAEVSELYEYQLRVKDIDPNPVFTFSLLESPNGMEINNDGLIIWTPEEIGEYDVEVRVDDGKYFDTQSYTITVTEEGPEEPEEKVNHVHKFTLSNAFIRYDDKFIYIYPMTRNMGNQRESINIRVFNMNTGDFMQQSLNLDVSQGKFNYIIMDRPLNGDYTYKIEARSANYYDVLYRTIEII